MKKLFNNQKDFIKHLKKGDDFAYSHLLDLHYKKLCDYATSLARDDFKSEDIVQNVIVRMWNKREKLNADISIKNYLYKSVYNEFIDQYRKDLSISILERKYIEGIDYFIENEDESKTKRLIEIVTKEIKQLPKKCKETFLLSKKSGLSYKEIADFQNLSLNTVENQMTKALSILRKKLKNNVTFLLFLLLGNKTNEIKK